MVLIIKPSHATEGLDHNVISALSSVHSDKYRSTGAKGAQTGIFGRRFWHPLRWELSFKITVAV